MGFFGVQAQRQFSQAEPQSNSKTYILCMCCVLVSVAYSDVHVAKGVSDRLSQKMKIR